VQNGNPATPAAGLSPLKYAVSTRSEKQPPACLKHPAPPAYSFGKRLSGINVTTSDKSQFKMLHKAFSVLVETESSAISL
jgi:hypothetical protein